MPHCGGVGIWSTFLRHGNICHWIESIACRRFDDGCTLKSANLRRPKSAAVCCWDDHEGWMGWYPATKEPCKSILNFETVSFHGSADPQLWGRSLVYFIMLSPPSGEAKLSQDPRCSGEFWESCTNCHSYHLVWLVELEAINMKLWLVPERGVGFGHSFKATWSGNSWWSMSSHHHISQKVGRCSLRTPGAANLQDFPQVTNYKELVSCHPSQRSPGYATSHSPPLSSLLSSFGPKHIIYKSYDF